MRDVERELKEEEIEKIETYGVYSIFPDWMLMGYGVYGARLFERDGKKWIYYSTGDSCD